MVAPEPMDGAEASKKGPAVPMRMNRTRSWGSQAHLHGKDMISQPVCNRGRKRIAG